MRSDITTFVVNAIYVVAMIVCSYAVRRMFGVSSFVSYLIGIPAGFVLALACFCLFERLPRKPRE
jgi:hypothetical protein